MATKQLNIQKYVSLKSFNTFGVDSTAAYFTEINSVEQLQLIFSDPHYAQMEKLILGGGSNLLFTSNFNGLVIKNSLKGIEKIEEKGDHILVKSMAGEAWHDLVTYCIQRNYAGIENLSLIPGLVGAAPMQNIGAYGVELKDVFETLEAFNCETKTVETFNKSQCEFGYRESVFKKSLKGKYIILSITLKLYKKPKFNTSYGAIQNTLNKMSFDELTIKVISDAVVSIRQSKLPDPSKLGNAGSFFKNPEIPIAQFETVQANFPDIPNYPIDEQTIKIPAGWLIEQCGWKGKVVGNTGAHKNQALVLVNYGNASGKEIYDLSVKIEASVLEQFGIKLKREVNIV